MWFNKTKVPVEISARHVHLSKKDLEALFGIEYQLKEIRRLYQPSDFAAEESVDIKIGDKEIKGVRVVGPLREKTQIEISKTDAIMLGANPPIRLSGDLDNSSPVVLIGPKGKLELKEGLIIARRHIHCSPEEAKKSGLRHGQLVSVEIKGNRALSFHCVEVRVRDDYKLCLHLDTDEGNSAGINKIGEGIISMASAKKE